MADDLKQVRPYINLAESLEDSNPIFAFYLRKYSIQKAHQVYTQLKSSRPEAADGVFQQLNQWMPRAEQLSKMLVGQIDIPSNMAELLDYTQRIFLAADNDYRAKNFSVELTQNFMTAWRFYEVINHFTPLGEDQQKRLKYAKAKTVEVHKALKQMQRQQEESYRPEPPQITPGRSVVQQQPHPQQQPYMGGAYSPQPPQITPNPSFGNNPYPTMSGFHIPPMQPFGAQEPFNEPTNSPPNNFGHGNNPYNFQAPTAPPQSNLYQPPPAQQQPYQAPFNPMQQPATVSPPVLENSKQTATKKRIDPERITAQNQSVTQLQNAISELSFNRIGHAKEAIRNALRLLEKYE